MKIKYGKVIKITNDYYQLDTGEIINHPYNFFKDGVPSIEMFQQFLNSIEVQTREYDRKDLLFNKDTIENCVEKCLFIIINKLKEITQEITVDRLKQLCYQEILDYFDLEDTKILRTICNSRWNMSYDPSSVYEIYDKYLQAKEDEEKQYQLSSLVDEILWLLTLELRKE